jgi:hypothetical protein
VPATFVGLVIFVAFLTPGFLHVAQRRLLVPMAERSALMETTSIVSISLATNAVALALFGAARWLLPAHTPDVGELMRAGGDYVIAHLPYTLGWAGLVLAVSCVLAVGAARCSLPPPLRRLLAPRIIESSAWCETLAAPAGHYPYAGLELVDGAYVSGRVVWFSTHLDETGDRELVLGPPLQMRADGGVVKLEAQRVIVAARDIRRVDVNYVVDAEPSEPSEPATPAGRSIESHH